MFSPTKFIAKTFSIFKKVPYLPIVVDEQLKIITLFTNPEVFSKMIELNSWMKKQEGICLKYHKFGGIEYTYKNKEIYHIHGDGLVDVKLNKTLKQKFENVNSLENHHIIPNSNMISYQIKKHESLATIKNVIFEVYKMNKFSKDIVVTKDIQ